jgi:hypothetical protein
VRDEMLVYKRLAGNVVRKQNAGVQHVGRKLGCVTKSLRNK